MIVVHCISNIVCSDKIYRVKCQLHNLEKEINGEKICKSYTMSLLHFSK